MPERIRRRSDRLDPQEDDARTGALLTPAPVSWVQSCQRTAGNAAVARMLGHRSLARTNGGTATAPQTQPTFKSNISTLGGLGKATQRQLDALQLLDTTRTGPWVKLKWDAVVLGAAKRILDPVLINQDVLEVCGPAAALHASAGHDPMDYAKLVVEVFEHGTAAGKRVNDKLLNGSRPGTSMTQVDWMVLSAMQDVTNTFLKYEGKPDEGLAQGYLPPGMETLLTDFAGCVKTTHYSCLLWGKKDETMKASKLLGTHGDDVVVVIAVAGELLKDPTAKAWKPNHFVRLLEPVVWSTTKVTTKIFTWGSTLDIDLPPAQFEALVYGYTVGARDPLIAL